VTTRGALIAVCGVGAAADTAYVSRLIAGELTRRRSPGAVLLTRARGAEAHAALDPALQRRRVVVADLGPLDEDLDAVLAIAAVVVCTLRGDVDRNEVAEAVTRHTTRRSARWLAAVTTAPDEVHHVRLLAAALPPAVPLIAVGDPATDRAASSKALDAALLAAALG
jgi:hypothetical protein